MTEKLAEHILLKIFYLIREDEQALLAVSAVCKRWHTLSKDNSLWRHRLDAPYNTMYFEQGGAFDFYATCIYSKTKVYYAISVPTEVSSSTANGRPIEIDLDLNVLIQNFNPIFIYNNLERAIQVADKLAIDNKQNYSKRWAGYYTYSPIFTIEIKNSDLTKVNGALEEEVKREKVISDIKKFYSIYYKVGFFNCPKMMNLALNNDESKTQKKDRDCYTNLCPLL